MPARNNVAATIGNTGFVPSSVSSFSEVRLPIANMASTSIYREVSPATTVNIVLSPAR